MPGKGGKKRAHTSRRDKRRRIKQSKTSKLRAAALWTDPSDPSRKILKEEIQRETEARWEETYNEHVLPLEGALLNATDSFTRTRCADNFRKALDDFLEKVGKEANDMRHDGLRERVVLFRGAGEALLTIAKET